MCIDSLSRLGLAASRRHISASTTFALLWEVSGGEPLRGCENVFLAGLAAAYPRIYAETSSTDLSDPNEVLIAVDALRQWRSDVVSQHFSHVIAGEIDVANAGRCVPGRVGVP